MKPFVTAKYLLDNAHLSDIEDFGIINMEDGHF